MIEQKEEFQYIVNVIENLERFFVFFNDTATTEIYTLSLHDALPISLAVAYDSYERHPVSRSNRKIKNSDTELDQGHLKELGDLFLQNRDYESSLINYLQILQANPGRYDLRYRVGVIFLLTGQLEAARKELARVLVQVP